MIEIQKKIKLTIITSLFLFSYKNTSAITAQIVKEPKENKTNKKKSKATKKIAKGTVATFLSEYLNIKYKERSFDKYVYVSVKHQQLYLVVNDSTIRKYPISTAAKGMGSKENSNQTPSGLHTVKKKIGSDVPYGGILKSRVYTGKVAKILKGKQYADADYVTTRILWLQGEELGINKGENMDSHNRFIYIHGTPEEGFIGQPASHGCIRMKNIDVMELYDFIDEGTPILILKY